MTRPRAAVPLEEIGVSTVVSTDSFPSDGGDALAVRAEYSAANGPDRVVGYLGVAASSTTAGEFDGFPQLKALDADEIGVLGFSANDSSDNYGVVGVGTLDSSGGRFLKVDSEGTIVSEVLLAFGSFSMLADGPIQVVGEAKIIGPLTVANEAQIIGPIRWQCPTDMDPVGTWCVDKAVKTAANAGPSINACHDEAKTLCPLQAILHCDQKNIENGTTGSCGNRTDSAEAVIRTCTIDTSAGGNVFDRFVEYVVVSASTATSANTVNREFFCCKRVSQ